MQKNFVYIMMIILVSFVDVRSTPAQTKLYDLSGDTLCVDFNPNGKYLATGDSNGNVRLWEVSSGQLIYSRPVGGSVRGVAFSSDGRYLASDGFNNGRVTVVLLEASNGTQILHTNLVDDATTIIPVAFSPTEAYVAVGDDVGYTYLWDVNKNEWRAWGFSKESHIYSVAFSPDGKYLATGDSNGNARLWELSTWGGDVADLNVKNISLGGTVRAVAFSPNGRYLAADRYDNGNESVYIYDIVSGRVVRQIDQDSSHGRGITALTFSPDGRFIAVGNVESEIIIYRIATEVIASVTLIEHTTTIQASGEVEDLAWSPDGSLISDGRNVWRTDLAVLEDRSKVRLSLPEGVISEVAFAPNGTYFVLNAQFPILTGVNDEDVSYRECLITLDLPEVPPNSPTLGKSVLSYLSQTF